jgi:hypothetical protein
MNTKLYLQMVINLPYLYIILLVVLKDGPIQWDDEKISNFKFQIPKI